MTDKLRKEKLLARVKECVAQVVKQAKDDDELDGLNQTVDDLYNGCEGVQSDILAGTPLEEEWNRALELISMVSKEFTAVLD